MFKIEIKTSGAAFHAESQDDEAIERCVMASEIERCCKNVFEEIKWTRKNKGSITDINGNKVGEWEI